MASELSRWPHIIASAIAAGTLDFLAHPGVGLGWLGPVALVPLVLVSIREPSIVCNAAAGLLAGLVAWGAALHWLPESLRATTSLSQGQIFVATVVTLLIQAFPLAVGQGGARMLSSTIGISPMVAFPAAMVIAESLVPRHLEYSHAVVLIETSWGRAFCSMFGREVSSYLIFQTSALVAIGLAMAWRSNVKGQVSAGARGVKQRSRDLVPVGATIALWLLAVASPALLPEPRETRPLRIALVQSVHSLEDKASAPRRVLAWHVEASKAVALTDRVDLFVWGETILSQPRALSQQQRILQRELSTPVLAGAVLQRAKCDAETSDCRLTNAVIISSDCAERCKYEKVSLVPFAESTPVWGQIALGVPSGPFEAGEGGSTLSFRGHSLGVAVCFEGAFAERARAAASEGAELWVNLVSDRWVMSDMGRAAHQALARLAAIEVGLPLLRLVDGGPSGVWGPQGHLVAELPSDAADVVVVRPRLTSTPSIYHVNRGTILLSAMFLLLALCIVTRTRSIARRGHGDSACRPQEWLAP